MVVVRKDLVKEEEFFKLEKKIDKESFLKEAIRKVLNLRIKVIVK
jgi:hypothetical protein